MIWQPENWYEIFLVFMRSFHDNLAERFCSLFRRFIYKQYPMLKSTVVVYLVLGEINLSVLYPSVLKTARRIHFMSRNWFILFCWYHCIEVAGSPDEGRGSPEIQPDTGDRYFSVTLLTSTSSPSATGGDKCVLIFSLWFVASSMNMNIIQYDWYYFRYGKIIFWKW